MNTTFNQTSKNLPVSLKRAISIYCTVSLFLIFEMAVQVSPSIMAFHLMKDLGIGAFALGIMSSVYFYTYTGMQIPSGLLFDRFKPKNIIATAIVTCSLGAILFGSAHSFYLACLCRLLMGLGSAFAFVSVLVVASDLFGKKHFVVLAGVTQMLAALGAMAGQLPVSILVNQVGWRLTMVFFGVFGIILAGVVWCLLNYEKPLITISKNNKFFFRGVKDDLKIILSNEQSWYIALYAGLLWSPMSGFASLWGVPFLIHFDQLSQNNAAFISSMMWLGLAIGSPLLGFFSNSLTNKIVPLWLSALAGVFAFFLVIETHQHFMMLSILLFIAGAACSGQALSFSIVRNNNQPSVRSTTIAFNNMAVVISGALFQPLIGWLLHSDKFSTIENFQFSISVLWIAYLLAFFVATFFIKEKMDHKYCDTQLKKNTLLPQDSVSF